MVAFMAQFLRLDPLVDQIVVYMREHTLPERVDAACRHVTVGHYHHLSVIQPRAIPTLRLVICWLEPIHLTRPIIRARDEIKRERSVYADLLKYPDRFRCAVRMMSRNVDRGYARFLERDRELFCHCVSVRVEMYFLSKR